MLLPFERRWFLTLASTIAPSGAHPKVSVGVPDVPLGAFLDDVFRRAPLQMRLGIRAATWVLTWMPLLWRLKLRPFGRLRPEDRVALLSGLAASDSYVARELPNLIKIVACMGWAGDPRVQASLGVTDVDPVPPAWARGEEAGS